MFFRVRWLRSWRIFYCFTLKFKIMAKLEDYGIRIIDHGCWSDPEVEWKKSDYQTLLFNFWDCVECFENDDYDFSNEDDLEELFSYLHIMTPSEYDCPNIYYEWEVCWEGNYRVYSFDDSNFFEDYKLSKKEDYVLHNSSQALKQALQYCEDNGFKKASIEIFRHTSWGGRKREYLYSLNGSTLKDETSYKKCA